jgi:hypothetical protein
MTQVLIGETEISAEPLYIVEYMYIAKSLLRYYDNVETTDSIVWLPVVRDKKFTKDMAIKYIANLLNMNPSLQLRMRLV